MKKKKSTQSRPFSNVEIAAFCTQMALVLKAGISSIEGITIMLEDTNSKEEQKILQGLLDDMRETGELYPAMENSGLFPSYMLRMVQIGEETGNLDKVMDALSQHYEREDSIARTIRNSVTYPMVMAMMMVVVIIVLLVKVMPIFQQVFIQLGTEMTGFSRMLMNLGTVINRYAIVLTAALLVIVGFIFIGTHTNSGRRLFARIGSILPFIRRIQEQTAACRFASGMALTLSSGLNPDRSMELASSLNEDPRFQSKLNNCREQMVDGADLSNALHKSGIFSGIYARMASIGSKTGTMEEVMERIAGFYQEEIDISLNHCLSILEPTLVISLSLVVGVILLSVMFPLMGIMSSI
jgi:type IV pilus assembly protein PilC